MIGINNQNETYYNYIESIKELYELCKTANIKILDKYIQFKNKLNSRFIIGKGKLKELFETIQKLKINIAIFNNDLTSHQLKYINSILQCKIIGRSELILNIFALRAKNKEAKLQVEYAQLSYSLPRLIGKWTHLSRIQGRIGSKGPGESQLEMDKRTIKKRMHKIKNQLIKIDTHLKNQRKLRIDKNIVCLIGYTNVGKSTLHNCLSNSNVYANNNLFTTLNSTIRQVYLNKDVNILLVDTIGFINKLPYHLISSFKSTLEEVKLAKLLIHVIDIQNENVIERIQSTNKILYELKCLTTKTIYAFNKADNLDSKKYALFKSLYENSCIISAKTGQGISNLKKLIINFFKII